MQGRVGVQMRLLYPPLNPRTQLKIRKRLSPSSVSGLAPNSKQRPGESGERHTTPRFDGREKERRFSLLSSPLLPPYPIGCRQAGRQLEEGGDLRQELVLPWDEQERRQRTEKERERPFTWSGRKGGRKGGGGGGGGGKCQNRRQPLVGSKKQSNRGTNIMRENSAWPCHGAPFTS